MLDHPAELSKDKFVICAPARPAAADKDACRFWYEISIAIGPLGSLIAAPCQQREQALVRADEPAAAGLHRHARPVTADTRIHHAQEYRTRREAFDERGQQLGGRADIERRQIGKQGHHRHAGRLPVEHGLDLARVRAGKAKISEEDDHDVAIPSSSVMAGVI